MDKTSERTLRSHYAQIYRFVRRRTRTDQQAEDVTQTVFADMAAADGLKSDPPLLLGWLHRVARRRLTDEVRRESRRPRNAMPVEAMEQLAAKDTTNSTRAAKALRQAIGRLPREQREVVVLKLLEGRSFSEISGCVGASPAACKMRLVRALEVLRYELEREGIRP